MALRTKCQRMPSRRQEARGGALFHPAKTPHNFKICFFFRGYLDLSVVIALYIKSPCHMFNGVFKPNADSPGSIAPTLRKGTPRLLYLRLSKPKSLGVVATGNFSHQKSQALLYFPQQL
ncbi:predicted protein [Coccidioides posadasii str. Silveira]|uniref:Predicted protein n=1 Tax=Coccidioides posadasii (strain RMSCC 757 / Silveira) TaxID=443226 RepID=E9D7B2_COCPS|nr:predicted protein [Coccidioides posadasii str. Silveira]